MEKTITTVRKIKGLPDDSGAPVPQSKEEIDRAERLREYRQKARIKADRVIRRFRDRVEPRPDRPALSENMNDNLVRAAYYLHSPEGMF